MRSDNGEDFSYSDTGSLRFSYYGGGGGGGDLKLKFSDNDKTIGRQFMLVKLRYLWYNINVSFWL